MKALVQWLGTFVLAVASVVGQIVIDTTNPIQFGIFSHGGATLHRTGGFTQLGDISKPPVPFGDATGEGIAFGALVNSPLSSLITANQTTASFHLALRVGFALQRVELAAHESQRFIVAGVPTDGSIVHSIAASLASFGGDGMVEYTPPFHDNLRFHGGARVAWVYSATFRQTEQVVVSGSQAVFIGGNSVRRAIEEDIPNARKYELYGLVGLSYNVPIEKRFAVVPEIFVNIPLARHTTDLQWRSWWIRAGVSVKVTIPTSKPIVRDTLMQRDTVVKVVPENETDTTILISTTYRTVVNETDDARYEYVHCHQIYERRIRKEKPIVAATIAVHVFERMPDSTLVELDTLRCREIVWTDFHPLLPYVFFEYGSSTLSTRYRQITRNDASAYVPRVSLDQMDTYYSLLNIIGSGLRQNPSLPIRIKGCVSRREQKAIPNWRNLARQRAEVIANYLRETWQIDSSRIELLPVGVPKKPSNERHDDGSTENQRVELYSDHELLQPVMIRDTTLVSATRHVRIATEIASQTPIQRWNITVEHAHRVLYKGSGQGQCPSQLDIELGSDVMKRLSRSDRSPLLVTISIEQEGVGVQTQRHEIPLSVVTLEELRSRQQATEVDRYILMLFDAGKSEPSEASRSVIAFVRGRIQPGSTVSVVGSTDRTGSLQYNMELSKRRAEAVAKLLSYPVAHTEGIGPDTVNYNNDLPEGRFHARTVKIEVEHPRPSRAYLDRP